MKLFAQHGYGPSDKILNGLTEGTIEGVIFSARYEKIEKFHIDAEDIRERSPNTEILLDPEIYACFCAHLPDAQLGSLNEWPFFMAQRRSNLEDTESVERVLKDTFEILISSRRETRID